MLLALDIGNTSVTFGLFDLSDDSAPVSPVVLSKIAVRKNAGADEYAVMIREILKLHLDDRETHIDCAAVSSVVPSTSAAITEAAYILSGKKPYVIGPGIRTGFRIGIYDPACLGADIVSNTAAALDICKPPFIIFDAGTANTITVVDTSCTLTGTIISPGLRISSSALYEHAELLESVPINSGKLPIVGRDTDESIRSGLIYGNALMLDGFVRNIRETVLPKDSDCKLGLIATGEFAKIITDHCRNKFIYDEALTVKGIAALYRLNNKQKNFV